MPAGYSVDFERAVKVAMSKTRSELMKMDSLIAGAFPMQSQTGGSAHERYIGPVRFHRSSIRDVNSDTPNLQHPSIRTRKNNYIKAELAVHVPRAVAQIQGESVSALASEYMGQAKAAYMREMESQIGELLIDTYRDNPVMDGRDATVSGGDFDTRAFPMANNRVPFRGSSVGQWDFLDLMESRVLLANAMQVPVTRDLGGKEVAATVKNVKYVIWCDNDTWFSFIRNNRAQYFNVDYTASKTAFSGDGLKIMTLQDMMIITTTAELPTTGRPTHYIDSGGNRGVGTNTASGNEALSAEWKPVMVLPVGAFSLAKPTADTFDLQLKEYQQKKFETIIYGECNMFGHRIYDELVLRYWVDIS